MIQLVWAQAHGGAIGRDNTIPWRLPEDLRRFREVTGSRPVVMGSRTWESLPASVRPLPGRRNIVISRDTELSLEGAEVVSSLEAALDLSGEDCSIIGGGEIYRLAMPVASALRVTEIDLDVEDADTFAPDIDGGVWAPEVRTEWQTAADGIRYRFVDYGRREAGSSTGHMPVIGRN